MWKLLKINFIDDQHLRFKAFDTVISIESELLLSELYYACYVSNIEAYIQISFNSDGANLAKIGEILSKLSFIKSFTLADRDTGSHIHSLGYKICKHLYSPDKNVDITQFEDVIHWMHNMLGYSYLEEEMNYRRWADGILKKLHY
jgi:hypothetical protein